jgi:hypothetical protein
MPICPGLKNVNCRLNLFEEVTAVKVPIPILPSSEKNAGIPAQANIVSFLNTLKQLSR